MASFRPSTQRTVAAFITASALGSVCYAWVAKGSGARSASSALGRSSPASRAFLSSTFGTRLVAVAIQSVSFCASSSCADRAMIPDRARCRNCPAAESVGRGEIRPQVHLKSRENIHSCQRPPLITLYQRFLFEISYVRISTS